MTIRGLNTQRAPQTGIRVSQSYERISSGTFLWPTVCIQLYFTKTYGGTKILHIQ